MNENFDIVIVGAGLIGLTCALGLAQIGNVALIEAKESEAETFPKMDEPFDSRVFAITRASQALFQELQVWKSIEKSRISPYQHMEVWDSEADGKIQFTAADFFEADLGHIIEQRVMKAALWQEIFKKPQITVLKGEAVKSLDEEETHLNLHLTSKTLKTKLAIAADGAFSLMRELAGISIRGWDYQQSAIVATILGSKGHRHTAFQRFAKDGPLALLPLSDPHTSSIVWTTTKENANALMASSDEDFAKELTRESHGIMGKITLLGKRHLFPLQTHHAKEYAKTRVVLVGDAAHTLHPLAGQGVNLGLKDVKALLKVLKDASARQRDIGLLPLLKRYQRERKVENQMMILAMEAFKRGFASKNSALVFLRNYALNFVNQKLMIKQFFAKKALG